jgi:hypothetical protein
MQDRKAPYRPRTDSKRPAEVYNDGVVQIYAVTDGAQAGLLPRPVPSLRETLHYQERRLGVQRNYQAAQNQIQVERVIRVPRPLAPITNQHVAVTEDGRTYRIDLVQEVLDVWPRSLDLTLARYEQQPSEQAAEEEDDESD